MDADELTAEPSSVDSGDRLSSIMDSDYDRSDEKSNEPEENGIEDDQIPSSEKPKEKKSDKEEDDLKEKSEDKEKKDDDLKKVEPEKKKIKYKVDGQEIEEEVTEQDLINDFSGRKAIQKRFNEIDAKNKEYVKKEQALESERNWLKKEMQDVRSSFSGAIDEFIKTGIVKQNPIDGIYNLLDKMGLDSKEYDKMLYSHFVPEVAKFLDLDEVGREAFMLKRENDWYKKGQSKLEENNRQTAEAQRKLSEENSLKRQAGISEEQFNELKSELEDKYDLQGLNTEQVLQWAKEKPAYNRAESIAEKVPGIDIVKVAKILLEFPDTTDDWMLEQLGYKKVVENKLLNDLKDKIPAKPRAKKGTDEEDEDYEMFKQFRRR